jgi:hypothetical protein
MGSEEHFPRELNALERELLLWVLPGERPGYSEFRTLVEEWKVVGKGRRGEGNYVLANVAHQIDADSPLPQLLAYGLVEGERGDITISVREPMGDQLEFEISGPVEDALRQGLKSRRRWTYSEWLPSQPCPSCQRAVREIPVRTVSGRFLVLVACVRDQRLWVYDNRSGINHPIPVTGFYNELMLQHRIQDPKIAFDSKRLFSDLNTFSDVALIRAFSSYNQFRRKVILEEPLAIETEKTLGWLQRTTRRLWSGVRKGATRS